MIKLTQHIAVAVLAAVVCAAPVAVPSARADEKQSLKFIGRVLEIAQQKFVRKSEADFAKMLKKGLDNLEIKIDEVLVDWREDENVFDIVVGSKRETFAYKEPKSWKDLKKISGEAFSFVYENSGEDQRTDGRIEYAMVNGMLASADRHSRIIPPRDYEEFIVETEGSFTGLGVVISARKGWITVVSPIEDTPAYRAGMKSGDRIVRIENESTVNMSLIEAVHRLRGPKGKPVNLMIQRDPAAALKPLTIVRDTIRIESVEEHLFDDGILYIKIKNFQRNTTDSLIEALKKHRTQTGLSGIILDLRDNPGGLLDQAGRVADMFLRYGTVFSIKSGQSIKSYRASHKNRFEIREKTVVLVNSGSASASEIVTGALKENDRGLTMGTTTFGKGSVQDIFEMPDGSALKLTVAKYLIPGNISIHKVGITPDIFIEEIDFSKDRAIYKTPEFSFRLKKYREENDGEEPAPEPAQPRYTFKVLNSSLTEDGDRDWEKIREPLTKEQKREQKMSDPLVAAARRIIAGADGVDRSDMLQTASGALAEISGEENERIREKLAGLKVDWSQKTGSGGEENPVNLTAEITPDGGVFEAGEEAEITVRVTNIGSRPVYRLTAVAESENRLFDGQEFIFGRVAPGESAEWKAKLSVPSSAWTRSDECAIRFFDASGEEVFAKTFAVGTKRKERPSIAYNYEIVDDGRFGSIGDGDGRIEKGETVSLLFKIRNTGEGAAEELGVYLKNTSGEKLFLEKAIEEVGALAPGEETDVAMRFSTAEKWDDKNGKAEFELMTNDFQIGFSSKYAIKIAAHGPVELTEKQGAVQAAEGALILGGSFESAPRLSSADGGASFKLKGSVGEWSKIELAGSRAGWIKTSDTVPFEGAPSPRFTHTLASSPVIKLGHYDLVTDKEEIEISGFVTDPEPIVNISFFSNNDKIHIINSEGRRQGFALTLPLEDGMNRLTITARDSGDLRSVRTFYIRKKS